MIPGKQITPQVIGAQDVKRIDAFPDDHVQFVADNRVGVYLLGIVFGDLCFLQFDVAGADYGDYLFGHYHGRNRLIRPEPGLQTVVWVSNIRVVG